MWIHLADSFVSIVQDQDRPANLLVRARLAGDLERFLGDDVTDQVQHTPDADYAFRVSVDKGQVAQAVALAALRIDYPNFKAAVDEQDRHDAYLRCWSAMQALQRARQWARWNRDTYEDADTLEAMELELLEQELDGGPVLAIDPGEGDE